MYTRQRATRWHWNSLMFIHRSRPSSTTTTAVWLSCNRYQARASTKSSHRSFQARHKSMVRAGRNWITSRLRVRKVATHGSATDKRQVRLAKQLIKQINQQRTPRQITLTHQVPYLSRQAGSAQPQVTTIKHPYRIIDWQIQEEIIVVIAPFPLQLQQEKNKSKISRQINRT